MIAWNKKNISFNKKKVLRKLFFQKKDMNSISEKIGISQRVIYRIIKENKWIKKRERYWLYLVKKAYREKKSLRNLCDISGVSSVQILRRIKQKYSIKTQRFDISNKMLSQSIEKKMICDYKKLMSSIDISKKYGFKTPKTVLDVLARYKIKRREAKIITYYNTNYFKKINSHDKAYILGLLLTDGYILKDYIGFGLQLQENDGYVLENIAQRLGQSASVILISCENKRRKAIRNGDKRRKAIRNGDKNFINTKDMKRLTVHNREIAEDLKKLCMVKNKTFVLRCPFIKSEFLSSFFRGAWDGDGTIGIAKTKNIWCKIVSASRLFLEDLKSFDIPYNFVLKEVNSKFYKLRLIGGNKETIKFLKWIYKDKNDLYLRRKYEKVQNKIN